MTAEARVTSVPSAPADMAAHAQAIGGASSAHPLELAAPHALVMITQISLGLVELFFIARLGVDALAGVSQVFPVLLLCGSHLTRSIGDGVVSAIACTLGRGQRQEPTATGRAASGSRLRPAWRPAGSSVFEVSSGGLATAAMVRFHVPRSGTATRNLEEDMSRTKKSQNKALVLEAFDTLFNKRDYVAAERYWSPNYIQHSAHIEPGRDGLFNLIKSVPATLKYEPGVILADGDFVIVHGRFSGHGRPKSWIAADILRIVDGVLVEHWDVLQGEASQAESKSGLPMFGDSFTE